MATASSVRPHFAPAGLRWRLLLLVFSWHTALSSALLAPSPPPNGLATCASSWAAAREKLRDPQCCVVSVCAPLNGTDAGDAGDEGDERQRESLSAHLAVLRDELGVRGPSDVDLRVRIDTTTTHLATADCLKLCQSVLPKDSKVTGADAVDGNADGEDHQDGRSLARALAELAVGMASFAADCRCPGDGVFLRLVCASSYRAGNPPFHTDKAPLRGYVTLAGPGTEFVARPCSPLEYAVLRSAGAGVARHEGSRGNGGPALRRAAEREFIVMKGDHYYRRNAAAASSWWPRAFACVHRSPSGAGAGAGGGGRRVIVSFDLADGDDDREWHDARRKRQWRAGMTQRKSRLVA